MISPSLGETHQLITTATVAFPGQTNRHAPARGIFLATGRGQAGSGCPERIWFIPSAASAEYRTILKPVAIITGGSSGIGLAAAHELLLRGYRVVLVARQADGLEAAAKALRGRHPIAGDVILRSLDVRDAEGCETLIRDVELEIGPVHYLLAAAGIVEPGLFIEQDIAAHRRQIDVNYLGTLNIVHPVAVAMVKRRRGHIVLVSSGAAFVGIYGYSAYAPSKFAVRGLGETLRAELAEHGISVSVAFPPDTDTPQYHAEQAAKPAVTKAISAGGGLFSAETVAARIIRRSLAGRFVVTQGAGLAALRWIHSLYAPVFLRAQARLARRMRR